MEDNAAIRRRRYCEKCGERFTTYERIDTIPLVVIKSDNTRETFDRDKILKGIMMSCNKRPVSVEQMEKLVSEIENSIMNSMKKEIESKEIGNMVMDKLKDFDEIAYVRFASVYRKFQDIDSFMEMLSKLLNERK
jgi:transcriptional repressor NrdR